MERLGKQVSPKEMLHLNEEFGNADQRIRRQVEIERSEQYNKTWTKSYHSYAWKSFIVAGYHLADAIIGTLEIPPGKEKALEIAARLFLSYPRTGPRDLVKWYDKNEKLINFLRDAAWKWDEKTLDKGEQLLKLGPFTVHNTLGLTGSVLDGVKDTLNKIISHAQHLPLPGFERALYGNVFLVGKLRKASVLAWYNGPEDVIYARPFHKYRDDFAQALLHELCHRYWDKFLDHSLKMEWFGWHARLAEKIVNIPIPRAGDVLDVRIRGYQEAPRVQEVITESQGTLLKVGDPRKPITIRFSDYWNAMQKNQKLTRFPTAYSAVNSEEHFCEAASLLALGDLKDPHKDAFFSIFVKKTGVPSPEVTMSKTAGTYVQISRDELEDWMDTLPLQGKWRRETFGNQQYAGIYLLPLSDNVGVRLSSTIGSKDDAMGRGMASMKLALVSLVTGQTLNRKAMDQDHFKRTINWRATWKTGFDRMRTAYLQSQGFYEALAPIKDRRQYQEDLTKLILSIPGWETDSFLKDMHERVVKGGVLTVKQQEAVERAAAHPKPAAPKVDPAYLNRLHALSVEAQKKGDKWLLDFLRNIAPTVKSGRPLSQRQQEVLDQNLSRYRVASLFRRAIHRML